MADAGDIYVSIHRRKVAYNACVCIFGLVIGVLWAILFPQSPWYAVLLVLFFVTFMLGVVPDIRLLFVSDPYLVVSDEGICIQDPLINGETIRWSEIQDLRIYGDNAMTIVLRHPADILARRSRVQRRYVRLKMLGNHGIVVSAQYFSMSSVELVTQITERYAAELEQHQVSILDFPRRRKWSVFQEQGQ